MSAMKRHFNRQQETWSVFLVALIAVMLYAAWGAVVLHHQSQANAGTASVASR